MVILILTKGEGVNDVEISLCVSLTAHENNEFKFEQLTVSY